MNYTKTNIFSMPRMLSLISACTMILWYFFDVKLSDNYLLKDVGIKDTKILSFILLIFLIFFAYLIVSEYIESSEKKSNINKFNIYFLLSLNIYAVILSYPKIIIDTPISSTQRYDLVVPVAASVIIAFCASRVSMYFQVICVFYRFRRRFILKDLVTLLIYSFVIFLSICALVYPYKNQTIESLLVRVSFFIVSFVVLYFIFIPRKKIFNQDKLKELSSISETLDHQVEICEKAKEFGLDKEKIVKRYKRKTINEINKYTERRMKNIKTRFVTLTNLEFIPDGNFFTLPHVDNEDMLALRIILIKKDSGEIEDVHDIKYKYVMSSTKYINKPNLGNDISGYLEPLAWKAFYEQQLAEGDANELLCGFAYEGRIVELKDLIVRRRPNVNFRDKNGWTPLLHAVANGHSKVVYYLMQKAADPNISNKIGATPLSYAAWYGNLKLCEALIKCGASIDAQDCDGMTPLMRASLRGHGSVVRLLLNNAADSCLRSKDKDDALALAVKGNFGDIARLLRKHIK